MKAQVLADFLTELPVLGTQEQPENQIWKLHVDGSSSKQGSEVGIKLSHPPRMSLSSHSLYYSLLLTMKQNTRP